MAAGGVQHPDQAVKSSGTADEYQEDGRNGMISLPGSGYPVGGGVRAADDGIGDIIPGEAESQGEVFVVWGGNCSGVADIPSRYAAWERSWREAVMGYHGPRRRATNIQDGLSNYGSPKELSG